jgi:hypothetical protein
VGGDGEAKQPTYDSFTAVASEHHEGSYLAGLLRRLAKILNNINNLSTLLKVSYLPCPICIAKLLC